MEYEAVKYVEGFVENIIFRNEDNGYTVFDITYNGEEVTCVGVLSYISAGEFIAAQGEFVKHPVYYMQFKIKSYEFRAPDDAKSVKRYLSSGAIKGIGEKMAENIVDKFGDDTFRIMEEEPERLAEIKGISIKKAMDIAAQLMDKRDVRRAMMFMQEFGISMKLANKIYTKYGQNIYTILKENPYRLADDIDGIGFKIADEIAAKAGIKVDSAFRIKSGIFYVLCQAAGQGHVYLPLDELESYVKSLLLIEFDNMESYIMDLAVDKKVVVKQSGDRKLVYAAIYYYMETSVARKLCDLDISYSCNDEEMEESIERIEQRLNIELDEIQKEAVKKTVQNGLVVITGGPGTGKTTLATAFSKAMALDCKRVQFTPDVMPSDLTGYSVYRNDLGQFIYQPGSVFCNLLLADEINRTSPKTQSALLEVMEERKVSVELLRELVLAPHLRHIRLLESHHSYQVLQSSYLQRHLIHSGTRIHL